MTYGVCGNGLSQQKPVNPANPQFIISATDPENCPVFLTDNENPPQIYTFTVTTPPPFTIIPTADVRKNLASWSSGNGHPTKYNTTSVIDCSGNTGVAPSQSKQGLVLYFVARQWPRRVRLLDAGSPAHRPPDSHP